MNFASVAPHTLGGTAPKRLSKELSPIFGDGLKDQAAAVWD